MRLETGCSRRAQLPLAKGETSVCPRGRTFSCIPLPRALQDTRGDGHGQAPQQRGGTSDRDSRTLGELEEFRLEEAPVLRAREQCCTAAARECALLQTCSHTLDTAVHRG